MPVKNQSDSLTEFRLQEFLPYRFVTTAEQIFKVFAENYEQICDLTVPEFRVLAILAEHGILSPTHIGQRSAMDKVKVSRATHGLIGKKLVRQSIDPNDGRGRLLRLTRKGISVYEAAASLATRLEADLFNALSRTERGTLMRALTKIGPGPEAEAASA